MVLWHQVCLNALCLCLARLISFDFVCTPLGGLCACRIALALAPCTFCFRWRREVLYRDIVGRSCREIYQRAVIWRAFEKVLYRAFDFDFSWTLFGVFRPANYILSAFFFPTNLFTKGIRLSLRKVSKFVARLFLRFAPWCRAARPLFDSLKLHLSAWSLRTYDAFILK